MTLDLPVDGPLLPISQISADDPEVIDLDATQPIDISALLLQGEAHGDQKSPGELR